MTQAQNIREGMQVYGANDQLLGTIERVYGDGFDMAGYHYSRDLVARVAKNRVYVRGTEMTGETAQATTAQSDQAIHVPVAEERLTVGKRAVELGEVDIRKTVTEEQQTVPVTLTHEEVHVEQRDVAERPATDIENLFQEQTLTIPLRGEEAVVAKEAIVTGEVVIEKDAVSEERRITDTVRKQRVDVDKAYQEARPGFEQAHTTNAGGTGRTFAQAEPNYRAGFTAAHDERYADQDFEAVEPDLRSQHEASGGGDSWAHLREEVREGWNRARGR